METALNTPSRITITDAGDSLTIYNPARVSKGRAFWALLPLFLFGYLWREPLLDLIKDVAHLKLGIFLCIVLYILYRILSEFLWLARGGELLMLTTEEVSHVVSAGLFRRKRKRNLGEISELVIGIGPFPNNNDEGTDYSGIVELRGTSLLSIKFGKELDQSEAEIVCKAIRAFADRQGIAIQ